MFKKIQIGDEIYQFSIYWTLVNFKTKAPVKTPEFFSESFNIWPYVVNLATLYRDYFPEVTVIYNNKKVLFDIKLYESLYPKIQLWFFLSYNEVPEYYLNNFLWQKQYHSKQN